MFMYLMENMRIANITINDFMRMNNGKFETRGDFRKLFVGVITIT